MSSVPVAAVALALAAAVFAGTAGIACGGDRAGPPASPTPTPIPSITAGEVVQRSADSMKALQSFRFRLSHAAGATVLSGGVSLNAAEGAVVAPDRLQVAADASSGRSFVKLNAVVIADDAWITNPLTGGWIKAPPGGNPFTAFDPGALVGGILAGVNDVRFSEGGAPGGKAVGGKFRISGSAGARILEPLVGDVDASKTVEFKLEVDAATFHLTRAEIRGAVSAGEDPGTVRIVDLSDFDAKIEIKPPA